MASPLPCRAGIPMPQLMHSFSFEHDAARADLKRFWHPTQPWTWDLPPRPSKAHARNPCAVLSACLEAQQHCRIRKARLCLPSAARGTIERGLGQRSLFELGECLGVHSCRVRVWLAIVVRPLLSPPSWTKTAEVSHRLAGPTAYRQAGGRRCL